MYGKGEVDPFPLATGEGMRASDTADFADASRRTASN